MFDRCPRSRPDVVVGGWCLSPRSRLVARRRHARKVRCDAAGRVWRRRRVRAAGVPVPGLSQRVVAPCRGLGCVALHAHTLRTRYGFIRRTASVGPTAWRCGCSNATRRASRASCARTASTVTWLTNSARHAWTYRYRATYRATASYYSGSAARVFRVFRSEN